MESTRTRASFERAGDNDERREEREHVGMGDQQRHAVAVWLRFRVACRRTLILRDQRNATLEEGTCKRFGS